MQSFASLLQNCAKHKSIFSGKAVHAQLIRSGFIPDVYTNNHLLSMYLQLGQMGYAQTVFDIMPKRNVITWTTLICSFSQMGLSEKALSCLRSMVLEGFLPNEHTYVGAISACVNTRAVSIGKEIHGRIYRTQDSLNSFVSNSLVNFYGKCGLLKSARLAFDAILEPNLVAWASLISSCFQCGQNEEGLKLFLRSLRVGMTVNEFTCSSVLGACTVLENLELGKQIHCLIVKCCILMDQFVITGLVNFYAKCGQLEAAHQAFLEANEPHLSAWTALIGGCVQQGKGRDAILLFHRMLSSGMKPSEKTFASVFGAIDDGMDVRVGKQLHSLIIKLGFDSFTVVCNTTLAFYIKRGLVEEALKTFYEMDEYDIVTWNAMITGFVGSGHYEGAIQFLRDMLFEGFDPNLYTYSSLLSICGDLPAVQWGKQIHSRILKPGFDSNVVVGSALIDMYAKCGRMDAARKVFDTFPSRNLISWNTMLVGYAQNGFAKEALEIYDMMQMNGVKPNDITFIGVLSACGHVGLLQEGLCHFNSMIGDYRITPKADHLACMVSLFARHGQTQEAFDFIRRFPGEADKVVWRCLLSGCKTNKDVVLGKYAAERVLSIDPDDTSVHIMLSNIYAGLRMWNELAETRKLMKEKTLKKDTGFSWTELKNRIVLFSASQNPHLEQNSLHEVLSGLAAQMVDEKYVPEIMFSLQCGE
ncbi:pentatricopeptide repeat-containing protein At3g49170, chloroplastic-like [Coffea eugenioides]|uniref:Pentatricopeptide repeat-containing protein At3g49170, chloroplastic-like isoform X2 n=1 Tax=Coffea arabica TaxID=13443 RepID=A0ABM4WSN7_COFAR|nr:pentatricopeptide repeat-containing protein At3g49170, chloroplastic-like [Coffea arabica]XP_027159164.1 pentatricopeptide repeat-containing protein At3g49170, chloroplastic-like [Coffea eugenioides]